MGEWEFIKNMFSKIKVLNPVDVNQKLKDIHTKINKWESLGVYHTPYSKKIHEENIKLINYALDCNLITIKEAKGFKHLSHHFKIQARHAVYVEKLQNENCHIYKLTCKTTKQDYLGQRNMEVNTLEGKKQHYVSCLESLIQLNKGQFEKIYYKMEDCNYILDHFDPVSRILEFENETKKEQAEGKILYQEDITSAMCMEDTIYSYISLKIYEEEGSYETKKNLELDNFIKNPQKYTENYLVNKKSNQILENLNKNKVAEEDISEIFSKLPEE